MCFAKVFPLFLSVASVATASNLYSYTTTNPLICQHSHIPLPSPPRHTTNGTSMQLTTHNNKVETSFLQVFQTFKLRYLSQAFPYTTYTKSVVILAKYIRIDNALLLYYWRNGIQNVATSGGSAFSCFYAVARINEKRYYICTESQKYCIICSFNKALVESSNQLVRVARWWIYVRVDDG